MAGYSGTPLAKKLGIKEGFHVGLANAPKDFHKELTDLPVNVRFSTKNLPKQLDLILLFLDSERMLTKEFPRMMRKITSNGSLWVAWPKKSSGVETDLSFNNVQKVGLASGLVDVKICAVNETWSGLKFVYRLKDR
ncbi:MAG TPA: hypothetical protein VJU86_15665 [Pyrinomonadaceae bacterium]|nr:hypothetical protein [Pyrinomonadaceae bacterium]